MKQAIYGSVPVGTGWAGCSPGVQNVLKIERHKNRLRWRQWKQIRNYRVPLFVKYRVYTIPI
jgi:hypothetical protein